VTSRPLITRSQIQIALGGIWLLDGLLQFQSYMYGHAFVAQVLEVNAVGQPSFIGGPILMLAHFYAHHQSVWNTLAGAVQCAIGIGLLLGGRGVRPALLASFAWGFSIWWFGEGFGMLFTSAPVSPLMGAPGAVLLYGLVGLLAWPTSRRPERSVADGGLIGEHGGRLVWSALWLEAAFLWLLNVNRSANSIRDQLLGMANNSPAWLAGWQRSVAHAAQGHGAFLAVVLALLSLLIAAGVWSPRLRTPALAAGGALALSYWVLGQSLGGPFWGGTATDVNAGPLLVLLALALLPTRTPARAARRAPETRSARGGADARHARAGLWVYVPVAVFGALLLIVPSAFSVSGSDSQAPMAMAGMDMSDMPGMSAGTGAAGGFHPRPATNRCTASICPVPKPGPTELAVAGELGSTLAAVWVSPEGSGLHGRLELLNPNMGPIAEPVAIAGSSSRRSCGPGCWTFTIAQPGATLAISATQRGHGYVLRLPIRWQRGKSAVARRLLEQTIANMRALPGVRVYETLTSGPPGEIEKLHYRLGAPDRMAYSINTGARVVIIGKREWSAGPGQSWQSSVYGGGSNFKTSNWYDWGQYDDSIQLLDEHEANGHVTADLALMSPSLPVWFQLHIDVTTHRVSRVGMTAGGHFMSDSYSQYAVPQRIAAPR
jgi:hypothetical protein